MKKSYKKGNGGKKGLKGLKQASCYGSGVPAMTGSPNQPNKGKTAEKK